MTTSDADGQICRVEPSFSARPHRIAAAIVICAICAAASIARAQSAPATAPADSRYLAVARRTVDTLLERAVDHWGPQHSAMIASVLDRKTLAPPDKMPHSPGQNRNSDRCVPYGSNACLQQNLYVCYSQTSTGKLANYSNRGGWTRAWNMGYGVKPTSMIALFCHTRQAQLQTGEQADAYRRLVLQAADMYRANDPAPAVDDLWPSEYGMAIFLELAAYRMANNPAYLNRARALADLAIPLFWDRNNPLPRASTKTQHYENITCADTLVLSLLALHEHVTGLKPQIPISDLDR